MDFPVYRPELIQLEINTDCNLACCFCPLVTQHQDRVRHRVTFDEFREVFGRNFSGRRTTIFSGFAETLLNPDVWRMIAYEKGCGATVHLATNGLLLDADAVRHITEVDTDRVSVTLDALEPELFRELRRGDVSPIRQNLIRLRDGIAASGARTEIVLNYVVTRSTVNLIETFLEYMRAEQLHGLALIKIMMAGRRSNAALDREYLTWDEYETIPFDALRSKAESYGIALMRSDRLELARSGCPLPYTGLYIGATWDVSPCPFLAHLPEFVFGNLLNSDIDEIYASARYIELRQCFKGGATHSACAGCACRFSS